jgi:hypothetical protein
MNKILIFVKEKKDYFVWGAIGALTFIFVAFVFSAFGLYFFGMKDNFFVRGAARIFPYPIARVNWSIILTPEYQKDVNTLIHFYKFESDGSGLPMPDYEEISSSVLDRLIKNRVVEKMARNLNIKITNDELDARFLEMTSKMGSPEEVEEVLGDMYGWSEGEFRKNIVRNILLQERIKEKLGTTADLDEEIEKELGKVTIKIYIE